MAIDQAVADLKKAIDGVLAYPKDTLIHRPKWGEITFESAKRDFDRVFDVLNHLKLLPLEYLTDQVVSSITNEINQVKAVFDQIDKFNIQVQNPAQTRDSIVNTLHTRTDSLYTQASPWIPFLAYQRGDVSKNIERLTSAVSDAQVIIEKAKGEIAAKKTEIDGIVIKAREASAAAGAAIFTQDFQNESVLSANRAKPWLRATWILAASTLVIAVLMWFFTESGLDQSQIWQRLTTKLAILALLISATAWCGKIYKALMHQSIVNRHKALSLQTFQAFSAAASDVATKDAVLLQTTRSIFSDAGTGFIDGQQRSSESDIKVLEVLKSIIPKSDAK
jgi:hypothetical protein